MKISLIEKILRNNKIIILIFVLLISCDSTSDSNQDNMDNAAPANPTASPSPTTMPTNQPLIPPQTAPPATNPPAQGPPSNPNPAPTNPPVSPTSSPSTPNPGPGPTQAPPPPSNPTPSPTQASPTPQPTATPTAAPTAPPPANPPGGPLNDFQSLVLDLVNQARAQARNCGSEFFPAAPAVSWDERVEDAALTHSIDMAQNQNFSHTGTDGSDAGDRLLMQNYNWGTWGENILVGLDNASDAVVAWLGSSGHCSIIMNSSLRNVGAGFAQGVFQGNIATYWTLLFATEN